MKIADITQRGYTRFYRFENADGKVWLFQRRHMSLGMQLYQPSGIKGRLLKALYPYIHWIPGINRIAHATTVGCDLRPGIVHRLNELWGDKRMNVSIFGGTPCVHQKITMQVSRGNEILGYVKFSDSAQINRLFDHEEQILDTLRQCGVTGIPEILYNGTYDNTATAGRADKQAGLPALKPRMFVQSTCKTAKSKVVHQWCNLTEDFLTNMYKATAQDILFDESDFGKAMNSLRQNIQLLPNEAVKQAVSQALDHLMAEYTGKTVKYGAYHGDFTPWNMFVENDKLFVFDWEYSALTYPAMLDMYHFVTQTAIFEKHMDADAIYAGAVSSGMDMTIYRMYLLDIIGRYARREQGVYDETMTKNMTLWTNLLQKINE